MPRRLALRRIRLSVLSMLLYVQPRWVASAVQGVLFTHHAWKTVRSLGLSAARSRARATRALWSLVVAMAGSDGGAVGSVSSMVAVSRLRA